MIEYSYSPEIAEADRPIILESRIYKDWLEKSQEKFVVTKVHFSSVDFLRKGRQPLFIKLDATATLPDGRPVHGIVLVRGNAVGVLVVLRCEGKKYLLLVRQPRFAIGEQASLEIPAGILDWTGDYRKVALSELEEEAQIKADDSELIDLILGGEGRVDRGNFLIRGFAVVDVVIGNDRVGMDLFLKVFLGDLGPDLTSHEEIKEDGQGKKTQTQKNEEGTKFQCQKKNDDAAQSATVGQKIHQDRKKGGLVGVPKRSEDKEHVSYLRRHIYYILP